METFFEKQIINRVKQLNSISVSKQKSELRKIFLQKRSAITTERRHLASDEMCSFLKEKTKDFSLVLSFASFSSEIDLWEYNKFLAANSKLALPTVTGEELKIYLVKDIEKHLILSKSHFLEPNPSMCIEIESSKPDCILVPAIAFDREKNRLGTGMGYYDRLLTKILCPTYGIGFHDQLVETLPTEPHDVPLKNIYLF